MRIKDGSVLIFRSDPLSGECDVLSREKESRCCKTAGSMASVDMSFRCWGSRGKMRLQHPQ